MGEAFLCGGWLFHLVSDGCLSSGRPFFIRNVSPTTYVPSSFSFFASGGVLSFNSERKYPAGGKKHYVKKKPAGGKKPTKKQAGDPHPPVSHKLAQLNSLAMEIS